MSDPADLPAGYWQALARTVGAAVDAGRIGAPKALRVTVHVRADPAAAAGAQEQTAAAIRRCADAWFGGPAGHDYGVGTGGRPAAFLLRWPGGQSALLAVDAGRGATTGHLMLMGSHGSIYHAIEPYAVPLPPEER